MNNVQELLTERKLDTKKKSPTATKPIQAQTIQELLTHHASCVIDNSHAIRRRHLERVANIQGQSFTALSDDMLQQLRQHNFAWVVPSAFALRFRYHASIRQAKPENDADTPVTMAIPYGIARIQYAGDIPDFALNNIETAISCGLQYFTVHSMEPFPGNVSASYTDPVVLGWNECPSILLRYAYEFDKPGSQHYSYRSNIEAVVIAVWDREGEMEVI